LVLGFVFVAFLRDFEIEESSSIFCNETLYPNVFNILFAFLKLTLLKNGISRSPSDDLITAKITSYSSALGLVAVSVNL
jgi:hypothetical protein